MRFVKIIHRNWNLKKKNTRGKSSCIQHLGQCTHKKKKRSRRTGMWGWGPPSIVCRKSYRLPIGFCKFQLRYTTPPFTPLLPPSAFVPQDKNWDSLILIFSTRTSMFLILRKAMLCTTMIEITESLKKN